MNRQIIYAPEAQADLIDLYDFIADRAGAAVALGYVRRLQKYINGFVTFPERGTRRDDIREGLRIVGFERRVTIAFHVEAEALVVERVPYTWRRGGRFSSGLLSSMPCKMTVKRRKLLHSALDRPWSRAYKRALVL